MESADSVAARTTIFRTQLGSVGKDTFTIAAGAGTGRIVCAPFALAHEAEILEGAFTAVLAGKTVV
jgi:hypothetical protein